MDSGIKELERKKKKEEKAREKELKKQKALEKAAKLQEANASSSKKSEIKNLKHATEEEYNPPAQEEFDSPTPAGKKKELSKNMVNAYGQKAVTKSWYEWWYESKYFVADAKSSKPTFSMVLPPPNVTGALHIGHALTVSIQDLIIRWKRMSGYNTLWIPGMDHAGIATQVVVEKKLMLDSNLTRHDIGREEFVSKVWEWKDNYGGTILKQLRSLGASLDWSRECFTMDNKRSNAVTEAFVRLHKQRLIYRDNRIVNWDCHLRTAVSEIEVEYEDIVERTYRDVPGYKKPVEFGVLTLFAYPLEQADLGEIVVATTRVETMLGDTGIAVHPDDEKYKHLHGKYAIHPFNGRRIPIIEDLIADRDLGTGAVKITPAHDPKDFHVGKHHGLEFINVFTEDGKINQDGPFNGLKRFDAREAITEALKKKGLFRGAETKEMRLGFCSRSKEVVEPMIKPQWYVSCSKMAKRAVDAAENRKLDIIPIKYTAEWKRWLDQENIRDWCVSRQLWWGHRVPAWYVVLEGDKPEDFGLLADQWVVARNEEEAKVLLTSKAHKGKKILKLEQDPDVLDTWFSSAIYSLSVLGWPEETEDWRSFYPTSVLETGHDILFFWVARMVMLGMTLGGDHEGSALSGDVPFKKVYLHAMIRDAHGRKMSKSLGNVIDPIDIINGISRQGLINKLSEGNLDPKEVKKATDGIMKDFPKGIPECGPDALRFALVKYTTQSDNINLDIKRVEGYRRFCNKLWNAMKFAMSKFGDDYILPPKVIIPHELPFSCQWILSVLNEKINKTVSSLEACEFSDAAEAVYAWWWYQLCDVFIEAIRPYFNDPKFSSERHFAQHTLWLCLDNGLRLLHPFMPFITEELWQRLPSRHNMAESIMISEYPSGEECWKNETVESEMNRIEPIVRSLRSLVKESLRSLVQESLQPLPRERCRRLGFVLWQTSSSDNSDWEIISRQQLEIQTMANLSSLTVINEKDRAPIGWAVSAVKDTNTTVYVKIEILE